MPRLCAILVLIGIAAAASRSRPVRYVHPASPTVH